MADLWRQVCHEMAGKRVVRRRNIVLDDLETSSDPCEFGLFMKIRTVLKAVKVAIHRAFAPVILNAENWSASRAIAGWMSPLAALTGFGKPKCEKIRRPRAWLLAL